MPSTRAQLSFARLRLVRGHEVERGARATRRQAQRSARARRFWVRVVVFALLAGVAVALCMATSLILASQTSCFGCAAASLYQGLGQCDYLREDTLQDQSECIDVADVLRAHDDRWDGAHHELAAMACPESRTERVCTDGGDVLAAPRALKLVGGRTLVVELASLCFTMCTALRRTKGTARLLARVRSVKLHAIWGTYIDDALALAPQGAVVVDVGAADGLITLVTRARAPHVSVVAVDPSGAAARTLASNVVLSGLLKRASTSARAVATGAAERRAPASGVCVVRRAIAPRSGLLRTMVAPRETAGGEDGSVDGTASRTTVPRTHTLLHMGLLGPHAYVGARALRARTLSLEALLRLIIAHAAAARASKRAGRIHLVHLDVSGVEAALLRCDAMGRMVRGGEVTWWFVRTRGARSFADVADALVEHAVYVVLRKHIDARGDGVVVAVKRGSDAHIAVQGVERAEVDSTTRKTL